ncbi:hypothetical protein [Sphingobium mellinum]|uniref:hypothetical protein n=1 Tax=Sphingobium mellinum TaxID=1387166 RepID=UPI0030EDB35B
MHGRAHRHKPFCPDAARQIDLAQAVRTQSPFTRWTFDGTSKKATKSMMVPVHFPDGTVRQVSGQLKQLCRSAGIASVTFTLEPCHCDPLWRYERAGERWVASRRTGVVTALSRPTEPWWAAIGPMMEDSSALPPVADEGPAGGDDAIRPA